MRFQSGCDPSRVFPTVPEKDGRRIGRWLRSTSLMSTVLRPGAELRWPWLGPWGTAHPSQHSGATTCGPDNGEAPPGSSTLASQPVIRSSVVFQASAGRAMM